MAGYLPRSEGELFRARPESNQPGSFPQSALLGEERILYETHPRVLALNPTFFWISIAVLLFFLLVGAAGATQLGSDPGAWAALAMILLFAFTPLAVVVSRARRMSYAITDQRVVVRTGSTYDSVPLYRVQSVRMGRKSAAVVFDLAPDPSDAKHHFFGSRTPLLEWKGVPGSPGVATFANSAIKYYQIRQRQKQLRDSVVTASMDDSIVCQYCGAMIAVSSLQPDNPRCPRCTAPVLVAPLGI